MWRRVIGRLFEARGHKIVECGRGRDLLAKLKSVDVVCLDLGLDDIHGFDLIARLRKDAPHVPIIVVTADPKVESAVQCMRLGVVDYVTKPAEPNRLSEAA